MKKKYVLNIKSGAIHSEAKNCYAKKRMKREHAKRFNDYQEAVDYYEDSSMEVHLCAICFPERTIGGK